MKRPNIKCGVCGGPVQYRWHEDGNDGHMDMMDWRIEADWYICLTDNCPVDFFAIGWTTDIFYDEEPLPDVAEH